MHAISSYRGNRPIHTQTHKQTKRTNIHTHRQDRLQYTVPLSLARSVNIANFFDGIGVKDPNENHTAKKAKAA